MLEAMSGRSAACGRQDDRNGSSHPTRRRWYGRREWMAAFSARSLRVSCSRVSPHGRTVGFQRPESKNRNEMGYIESNLLPGETVVQRARLHWIVFLKAAAVV